MASISLVSDVHVTNESVDAGKHGKDYEIEISKFIFKRILDSNYKNFKFTREKIGLGKFDDLILTTETSKNSSSYTFIQLKHSMDRNKTITFESLAENKGSYFYLPRYYDHYLELIKNISNDPNFSNITSGELVICTNLSFANNLSFIIKQNTKNEGLFKNSGFLYKLQISNEGKRQIFSKNYLSNLQRLAHELCHFIMLEKYIDINVLIKDGHASLVKDYHVILSEKVIDVSNQKIKLEFFETKLNDDADLVAFRNLLLDTMEDFYDTYKNVEIEQLKRFLNISRKKAENVKRTLYVYGSKGGIHFLKDVQFNIRGKFGDLALCPSPSDFPSNDIIIDKIDQKIDEFLASLTFATKQENNENIVRKEMTPNMMIAFNDRMNHWYHSGSFEEVDTKVSVRKREWLTKAKLASRAMDTDIIFQGRKIKLNQIVSDKESLDSDILMRIFCGQEININNVFDLTEFPLNFYIPRVLRRQRKLNRAVLMDGSINVLLLSSLEEDWTQKDALAIIPKETNLYQLSNIKQESRFVFISSNFNEDDFNTFVDEYHEIFEWTNIHWIEVANKQLFWKKTFGSMLNLRKYFHENENNAEVVHESQLFSSERFVLISSEPGMGKSTLFENIAYHLVKVQQHESNPGWIIKISLGNCLTEITNRNTRDFQTLNDIAAFLADVGRVGEKFCQKFLIFSLLNNRVFLLLDGFDELISPSDQHKICKMLLFLKNNVTMRQIWVSTRPHLKNILEGCLQVVPFSIEEINETQQIQFLCNYWKHNSTIGDEIIHQYTTRIVKHFNAHMRDHDRKFLGIPLQTYMFAVAFLDELVKGEVIVPKLMAINVLFKKFLEVKYNIYLRKSSEISLPHDLRILFMQALNEAHQNYALRYGGYLSEESIEFLTIQEKTITTDTLLKIGIIYECTDSFQFVHKTLCEYLIAERLCSLLVREKNYEYCGKLIENFTSTSKNSFLLYAFDIQVTEMFPLHRAVLIGDTEKVRKLQKSEVDAKDYLGRSLAYYAVQYDHFNIITILLHMDAFSEKNNDPFLMVALESFIKRAYDVTLDRVHTNSKLFALLFRYSTYFSLNLVRAFDIHMEIKFKSWTLVRKLLMIYRLNKLLENSVLVLDTAFRHRAPIDIVLFILGNIQECERPMDPRLLSYSNFVSYLFMQESQVIVNLINQYKFSFGASYKELPMLINIYDYFDLTNTDFGTSLFSLFASVQKRAQHYTEFVQILLESGASYIILPSADIEHVFSKNQYNIRWVTQPIRKFLDEKYTHSLLNTPLCSLLKMDSAKEANSPAVLSNDLWNIILAYKDMVPLDMDASFQESIVSLAEYFLASSDAKKLLYTLFIFFEAITANDYEQVSKCLEQARTSGWLKAFLTATDGNFNTGEEVAKSFCHLKIYFLLWKQKRNLRIFPCLDRS